MNLLLLATGLRAWSGSPHHVITRLLAAVSIVSIELQLVTWTGWGTFRHLIAVNAVVAAALWWWTSRRPRREEAPEVSPHARVLGPAVLALAVLIAVLNVALPLEPVDPYHLERMERIERSGTVAFDPAVDRNDPRLNVLSWLYEFLLVDISHIPLVGNGLVVGHGILGLALYSVTAWAMFGLLQTPAGWLTLLLFAIPLVFHQFVLIKNDLFGAVPAMLALTWAVSRMKEAPASEFLWAGWLTGLSVAIKLTSYPVALVIAGATLARRDGRSCGALVAGGVLGALAGGLVFTLVENTRVYGDPLSPLFAVTGRPATLGAAADSMARFAISLVDLGVLTHRIWPQAGGWGGTYGLPLVWALAVLGVCAARAPEARRALTMAVVIWTMSSATNIDMGTNHRYVLAPGVMLVAVGVTLASREGLVPLWLRRSGVLVILLSSAQMLRSAVLYLVRMA